MIPLDLQDALVSRMKEEFSNIRLKNIKNEMVPLSFFPQHLPNHRKSEDDNDPYPCIIIRIANGSEINETEASSAIIQFIIGVVERDSNNQGYKDALTVANKIMESLKKRPTIGGRYELTLPINWAYNDEDADPYFFAGLETNWKTPSYIREDVENLI
ncbi:hypothetical protein J2Z76_000448 [Sedimentibacter acidaminivorans]|uniref:Uncharacterized protein n=1 Tax=Sedimentibacter acidaminivorans TaxID=913099 RepID=A0ABS4GA83_9FIRM|nr:hypothetical protein [Sedimentibacter acidaminivorans]MBP1924595.1 hypothetical protein [Sedimentibacter acidaminivorans]